MKKRVILFLVFSYTLLLGQEVKIVFSHTTPPYTFLDGTGISVKIVREALQYKGYSMKPEFINISRGIEMYKNGFADGNALVQTSLGLSGFYSDYFIQYHNVVVTLKSSNIKLKNLEDLSNYNFVAFQQANIFLGDKFKKVSIKAGKNYSELADQRQQALMFLNGRIQAVVLDETIYKYYKHLLAKENKIPHNIEENIYDFFEPTNYRVIFKDEKIQKDFDEGIKYLKKTGRYKQIFKEYTENSFQMK